MSVNLQSFKAVLLLLLLLLQGHAYPGSLFSANYTTDIPYVLQEGRGPSGGEYCSRLYCNLQDTMQDTGQIILVCLVLWFFSMLQADAPEVPCSAQQRLCYGLCGSG
jgi:hypothetical protein